NDYLSTSVTGTGVLSETEWSVFTVMMQDGSQAQNGVFSWGFDGFNRASLIATDNDSITFMGTRNADPSGKSSAPQPAGWDNNYHTLYGYLNSANDGEINVDGTMIDSWTNMTYNPDFSTNSTMSIGRDNTFAYYLEGDIAELVLFKRAPSAEERTQIVCYFHKKYGITVSTSCD
ncbi:MAG: hypothetical protein KDK38_16245, partial [Leptospiraceae bacterium]|nr:hypothetical protein [Leptospiraceae bacterium]